MTLTAVQRLSSIALRSILMLAVWCDNGVPLIEARPLVVHVREFLEYLRYGRHLPGLP
jgi:hypothetical protein